MDKRDVVYFGGSFTVKDAGGFCFVVDKIFNYSYDDERMRFNQLMYLSKEL